MNEIKITIDKRTELMSVLLYISNYRKEYPNLVLYNKDIPYVKDVYNAFSRFSNHRAVELLNEIIEKLNFSYDAPYRLAWELSGDYSSPKTFLKYPFETRLQSSPLVEQFMNEIKDFAQKSEFEIFYEKHLEYYKKCIDKAKDNIDFEQLSHFEEFFKENTNREYIVNLLPLAGRTSLFADGRSDEQYVVNVANNESGTFDWIAEYFEGIVFRMFALCKVMRLAESDIIKVPESKEFSETLKSQYTAIGNLQYICNQIVAVLRTIFKEKFCPQLLKIDPNLVQNELEMFKSKGRNHVYEIYDILTKWQKSNDKIDKYLQQLFDLFK